VVLIGRPVAAGIRHLRMGHGPGSLVKRPLTMGLLNISSAPHSPDLMRVGRGVWGEGRDTYEKALALSPLSHAHNIFFSAREK